MLNWDAYYFILLLVCYHLWWIKITISIIWHIILYINQKSSCLKRCASKLCLKNVSNNYYFQLNLNKYFHRTVNFILPIEETYQTPWNHYGHSQILTSSRSFKHTKSILAFDGKTENSYFDAFYSLNDVFYRILTNFVFIYEKTRILSYFIFI